jgi:hypothetical protein
VSTVVRLTGYATLRRLSRKKASSVSSVDQGKVEGGLLFSFFHQSINPNHHEQPSRQNQARRTPHREFSLLFPPFAQFIQPALSLLDQITG